MADVVKAPVPHVDTAVVGVRVPSPAEEKTHIGQTPAQKVPQLCGRISVEDRRCKAELDMWKKRKKKKKKKKKKKSYCNIYTVISVILSFSAMDDIPRADDIRTLVKDIWDLRIAKLRSSIDPFVKSDMTHAKVGPADT